MTCGEGSNNTYTALGVCRYGNDNLYAGHYECCAKKAAEKWLLETNQHEPESNIRVKLQTWQGGKPIQTVNVTISGEEFTYKLII